MPKEVHPPPRTELPHPVGEHSHSSLGRVAAEVPRLFEFAGNPPSGSQRNLFTGKGRALELGAQLHKELSGEAAGRWMLLDA